ncbi:aldehyde oxidase GLOX [Quercus suber]|uniref:Aldehyde oxidase glox1 n=1 Tax=Quercus suber TaxID=58331 RepID=A0AAW0JFU2_QUESU
MASKNPSFFFLLLSLTLGLWSLIFPASSSSSYYYYSSKDAASDDEGDWVLLQSSIGISAMHMQLLKNNMVVIFDRMDMGPSNLSLPNNACIQKPGQPPDCTAHSVVYDVASNTVRPLLVQTDTWCSSGSLIPNGTLVQTGGYHEGDRVVRTFTPCDDSSCDWTQLPVPLGERRWYASNQLLPDGRVIIVGGRRVYTYEFFPKTSAASATFYMSFLKETCDGYGDENNLYPFLHLLPDGNLYVFANERSILFDYNRNRVVKEFPVIPGEFKRNYPSTGSSVLLPLWLKGDALPEAEVMICGGAPYGAFNNSNFKRVFVPASNTCGRMKLTDPEPKWVMEVMPMPRVMSDMVLLPNGEVLIINGAMNGTAGWEDGANPVFNPVLYKCYLPDPARRFVVLSPSKIPRMYHSTAILLADGRVLVGGSNPHEKYNFTSYFPTDLSLEAFSPYYLKPRVSAMRPSILSVETTGDTVLYKQVFAVTFQLNQYNPRSQISVSLVTPSFTTHSYGMNQRLMFLEVIEVHQLSTYDYKVTARGPPTATVAPPGYYMLFVVHAGIPSQAVWVKVV